MTFLSSLLFAVSSSLDALMVGITYGIRKIRVSLLQNLLVSLITLGGTMLAIGLGSLLAPVFSAKPLTGAGSAVLIGMGVYYLIKFLVSQVQKYRARPDVEKVPVPEVFVPEISVPEVPSPEQSSGFPTESPMSSDTVSAADADCGPLTHRELLLLGIALSANNMGIGIGASMAGIPLWAASFFTFLCSMCFLGMGNCLGNCLGQLKFLRLADRFADPLSGLLLILLGICQLL